MTGNRIRPKLVLRDAESALRFYVEVLGATEVQRYAGGGRVGFAELRLWDTTLTVKDEDEVDPAPQTSGAPGPVLDVVVDDPDHWAEAIQAAGGEVLFAVRDQPYGGRGGRVRDPFGVQWILATPH